MEHEVSKEVSKTKVEERLALAIKSGKYLSVISYVDYKGKRHFELNTQNFPTGDFLAVIAELAVELSVEEVRLRERDRLRRAKPGPLPEAVFDTPPSVQESEVLTVEERFGQPSADDKGPREISTDAPLGGMEEEETEKEKPPYRSDSGQ